MSCCRSSYSVISLKVLSFWFWHWHLRFWYRKWQVKPRQSLMWVVWWRKHLLWSYLAKSARGSTGSWKCHDGSRVEFCGRMSSFKHTKQRKKIRMDLGSCRCLYSEAVGVVLWSCLFVGLIFYPWITQHKRSMSWSVITQLSSCLVACWSWLQIG